MTSPDAPSPSVSPPVDFALLAAYVLVEPLVSGKIVVEVGEGAAGGLERLRRSGATEVHASTGEGFRIDKEDRSVDIALCLGRLSTYPGDVERHRWLAELKRVLRPTGFCVVRIAQNALVGSKVRAPGSGREIFEDLLRYHFSVIEVVAETSFSGVSFSVPGVEDVAINEDMGALASHPHHHLAFCASATQKTWQLPESLLVPMGNAAAAAGPPAEIGVLEARIAALTAERDGLRESVMTLSDEGDRRDQALSAMRREVERQLRQVSESASALELAQFERERAVEEARAAERGLRDALATLEDRQSEVAALRKELADLRALPGAPREGLKPSGAA